MNIAPKTIIRSRCPRGRNIYANPVIPWTIRGPGRVENEKPVIAWYPCSLIADPAPAPAELPMPYSIYLRAIERTAPELTYEPIAVLIE